MMEMLRLMIKNIEQFRVYKKNSSVSEYYSFIGAHLGVGGDVIENFLKNIGRDYRDAVRKQCFAGESSEEPKLRGSAMLFALFKGYYSLYYPNSSKTLMTNYTNGSNDTQGSVDEMPMDTVMDNVSSFSESAHIPHPTVYPPQPVHVEYQAISHALQTTVSQPPLSQSTPALATQRKTIPSSVKRHSWKRKRPKKHPVGMSGRQPDAYQRQHLQLLHRQNELLADIATELRSIRHGYYAKNVLNMAPPYPPNMSNVSPNQNGFVPTHMSNVSPNPNGLGPTYVSNVSRNQNGFVPNDMSNVSPNQNELGPTYVSNVSPNQNELGPTYVSNVSLNQNGIGPSQTDAKHRNCPLGTSEDTNAGTSSGMDTLNGLHENICTLLSLKQEIPDIN